MSRDIGRGRIPWVEIDGARYPLLRNPDGSAADVQRRPLVQFPSANKIGPNERPAKNAVLSSITFAADVQRGVGTYKHSVLDGIDTCRKSSLDTRFKGGVCPPPLVTALTACPTTANGGDWSAARPVLMRHVRESGGDQFLLVSDPERSNLFAYDIAADAWTHVANYGFSSVLNWRNYIVMVKAHTGSGADIATATTDATSWTTRDTSDWGGLAAFGNRLWSFNHDDGKLYSCTDPTLNVGGASGCWTAQSEELFLRADEWVQHLLAYRDKGGRPALYVFTNYRIIGYDDESGEFEEFEDLRKFTGTDSTRYTVPFVWMRDKLLYTLPFGAGAAQLHVYQFTGNVNEVGPTRRGGFAPADQFSQFDALDGNVHWMYAACRGEGNVGATHGAVVAMNELGGWHTIYRRESTSLVRSLCVVGGDIYVMHTNGAFSVIADKDELTIPHLRYASTDEVDPSARDIQFGLTDCGLPNHEKLGASVYVAVRNGGGTYGLGTDATLEVSYAVNGGAFTTLATLTDASTFPIELPLPGNDPENQDGVVFRDIELAAELTCPVVALQGAEVSVLEELTLNFSKWEEPRWAYQMVIDLREDSFRRFASTTDERRGLGEVRQALEALLATQTYHRVKYGCDEWEVDLKAADLVLAGRENPVDGSGLFPLTVRDVSAEV